ncbi:MAG: hypothetical protein ACRD4C_06230 [Candidatus Acidiferrales bacterium]
MSCIAPDVPEEPAQPTVNKFAAADIAAILRQRGCIQAGRKISNEAALQSWLARAASLLGPVAPGRATLDSLLELLFTYDADAVLRQAASHGVLTRSGAREAIRELAHRVLEGENGFRPLQEDHRGVESGGTLSQPSDVSSHSHCAHRSRTGEGELDRVILLLDSAAKLEFAVPVKSTQQRMLEFCSAFD